MDVTGDVSMNNSVDISNNLTVNNRMDVTGDVSLNKNVSISGELIVFGDISGSGKNLYSIPNEALDNSVIKINGNDVSLGGELNFITSQWVDNSFGDISNIYYTDGNVGIGISGPDVSYALDISGSLKVSNNVSIGTDTLDTSYALDISGRLNCMELLIDGSEPLFGSQNIKVYDTTDISINNTYDTVSFPQSTWSVDNSNNLTYTNGRVGIGLSVPDASYVLDISGDINITGNIYNLSLIHI